MAELSDIQKFVVAEVDDDAPPGQFHVPPINMIEYEAIRDWAPNPDSRFMIVPFRDNNGGWEAYFMSPDQVVSDNNSIRLVYNAFHDRLEAPEKIVVGDWTIEELFFNRTPSQKNFGVAKWKHAEFGEYRTAYCWSSLDYHPKGAEVFEYRATISDVQAPMAEDANDLAPPANAAVSISGGKLTIAGFLTVPTACSFLEGRIEASPNVEINGSILRKIIIDESTDRAVSRVAVFFWEQDGVQGAFINCAVLVDGSEEIPNN